MRFPEEVLWALTRRYVNVHNLLELGICSISAILESYNCFRNFYTLKK